MPYLLVCYVVVGRYGSMCMGLGDLSPKGGIRWSMDELLQDLRTWYMWDLDIPLL